MSRIKKRPDNSRSLSGKARRSQLNQTRQRTIVRRTALGPPAWNRFPTLKRRKGFRSLTAKRFPPPPTPHAHPGRRAKNGPRSTGSWRHLGVIPLPRTLHHAEKLPPLQKEQ